MFWKKKSKRIVHIIEDNCIGCKCCIRRCRRQVLGISQMTDQTKVIVERIEACSGCGKCLSGCLYNAIELITHNQNQ